MLCPDTRVGKMMKSLTSMHAKFEMLIRHPREEEKVGGKNKPEFKEVVLGGDVN